ncbi:Polar organelle development protein [Candidatus Rubidus massiliensis]|nr:Polar organelle development protein [Candidatus Rubidus massiliensis]
MFALICQKQINSELSDYDFYKKMSDKGSGEFSYSLGNYHFEEEEFELAYEYYLLASEQGNVPALFQLAHFYSNGIVVGKSKWKALDLYTKAAHKGHSGSQILCGVNYQYNLSPDYNEASYYYLLAIEGGDLRGLYYLAKLYLEDKWQSKNSLKAFDLLHEAINQIKKLSIEDLGFYLSTLCNCYFTLAKMYENGLGAFQSDNLAFKFYQLASEFTDSQEIKEIYYALSRCYKLGIGTDKNDQLALEYLFKSGKAKDHRVIFYKTSKNLINVSS